MPAIPSEEEWLERTAKAQEEAEKLQMTEPLPNDTPVHPIAQLQGPFEESIAEAAYGAQSNWQVYIDAQSRRDQILTAPVYERLCGRRWRQRPNEKYHPLWKLVAQISFGLHLLSKGLAKSESAVIRILQVHVAELDGFIENTTEDVVLAFSDVEERLSHLRLPLGNLPVFNDMLADQIFRQTVVVDHERIEHIIQRTAAAMEDSIKDIEKGLQSVRILGLFLKESKAELSDQTSNLDSVYGAMVGNVDGWKREFKRLKRKVYKLAMSLSTLNQVAFEISRLVGIASRKSIRSEASMRPISRGQRQRKPMPNITESTPRLPPDPLRQTPADPDSYTAEARAISIVAGFTPATLVQTTSRQESPSSQRRLSLSAHNHHQESALKEFSKEDDRYYSHRKTPRRSLTAPELSVKNAKNNGTNERNGKQKRPKTSSSKLAERHALSEKESVRPLARLGSKLDRFQKATSKFFSISAFSNSKHDNKKPSKAQAYKNKTTKPIERSWIDFESRDQQMSWAHESKGISEMNTLASKKATAPEFPHLLYMTFLEDQSASDEEDEEEDADVPEAGLNDENKKNDQDSEITALPIMKDSVVGSENPSGEEEDDDMAAEVASTYSAKHRKFRAKDIHVPPLPKPKFGNSYQTGAKDGHVIYQNRHWLRQKPSTVFSFISSKKGPDEASLNSPSFLKSRQNSDNSETPSRSKPSSIQSKVHGHATTEPQFHSTWTTHKGIPTRNTETPPISPTTFYDAGALSSSAPTSTTRRPQTGQSSARGSIFDRRSSTSTTNIANTASSSQHGRKESATMLRRDDDVASQNSSTTTLTFDKPKHANLSLFPRTPTTPRVKKFVSMSSLREVTLAESTEDGNRPPRSRG